MFEITTLGFRVLGCIHLGDHGTVVHRRRMALLRVSNFWVTCTSKQPLAWETRVVVSQYNA